MVENLALTTDYQIVDFPVDSGSVLSKGGQCVITIQRTGGTGITFKVDEYFTADTGWVPKMDDDGTTLTAFDRTSTEAVIQYPLPTLAEMVRVQIKGTDGNEVVDVFITMGEIA